ncbi:hypothetical protein JCM10207_000682 [Rhodosporidiobolus poonsookiae]
MNDSSPPGYSAGPGPALVLVNLTPPANSTSFQLGHLGYGPAFVAGDVQVKFAGSDADSRPAFSRLEVAFVGVEKSGSGAGEEIELFSQRKVLWGVGAAGSSSSATSDEGGAFPPSNTPFKLELTSDLPTCLHLGSSSLEYTLTASLFYADSTTPPLVRCAPVHLTRTSPPGSLLAGSSLALILNPPPSTAPRSISTTSPIAFSFRLPRTVFRRNEPIELVTRVEVPDTKVVGEGLRLRTISAELVRTIVGPPPPVTETDGEQDGSAVASAPQPQLYRNVLAHSGKSARFSPSRPIVIKLVLHPPVEMSCETITQFSILHTVTFSVRVIVGLFNNASLASSSTSAATSASSALDAVLSQDVFIVPDLSASHSDKQKEADRDTLVASLPSSSAPAAEAWMPADGPVPTYVEDQRDDRGESLPVASGSATIEEQLRRNTSSPAFSDLEEEYDGYEDLSLPATLSLRPPPPAIDDDVSPPSAGETATSLSLQLAAQQGMPLDLDHDERDLESRLVPYEAAPPEDGASDSPPPPGFHAHSRRASQHANLDLDLEPATPPPHVDFPPLSSAHLPSTPPSVAAGHLPSPSSPPPPASPLNPSAEFLSASGGALDPPPYFGAPPAFSPGLPPPPPLPPVSARPGGAGTARSRSSSRDGRAERRYDPAFGLSSAGSASSDGDSVGAGRSASAERVASGIGEGQAEDGPEHEVAEEEDEEDEPHPPPYEQRDAQQGRVEMMRFGVNRLGELVL